MEREGAIYLANERKRGRIRAEATGEGEKGTSVREELCRAVVEKREANVRVPERKVGGREGWIIGAYRKSACV